MSDISQFHTTNIDAVDVTIANSATVSGAATCNGMLLQSVTTPAEFDGTTMTFQGSVDGGTTFYAIYNTSGSALSITTANSRTTVVESFGIKGYDQIKVVAGTSQTGATVCKLKFVSQ